MSDASSYRKGRRFEWRVKKFLEAKGYWVMRSGGSKGPPDLAAAKKGEGLFLIECKVNKSDFSSKERLELLAEAEKAGATALLAFRAPGNGTRYALFFEEVK